MKKLFLGIIVILYIVYIYAVTTVNNKIGDLISPILTLIACTFLLYGFVIKEKSKIFKISGILLTAAIFSWFVSDFIWGVSTLFLHTNPEENLWIIYGYSFTNLLFFLSLSVSGYAEMKNLNKIQVLLDTLIISLCIMVLLWIFVFNQDVSRAEIIKSDRIAMIALILDSFILALTNIWFFSTRSKQIPLFYKLTAIGVITFVLTDYIYYYIYFYTFYEPNSWVDGLYMLAFTIIAIGGYVKTKEIFIPKNYEVSEPTFIQFKKEAIIILVPLFVIVFKRSQIQYFFLLALSIVVYYILLNYTQKNCFRERIHELEKKYITELERKVEDRTEEIVKIMNTDIITGLYNRRFLEEYLSRTCETIEKKDCLILFYIDINIYKSIKSLYGKYFAESLLKEVGKRIKDSISDLGNAALLASYGEDVFVVTLLNPLCQEQGDVIGQQIINKCTGKYYIENKDLVVTLNIGISCYPKNAKSYEELIKNADHAMMYARKKGSNRIFQYNESIGEFVNNRNRIEIMLKKVNFDEAFILYFQPQVSCDSGKIIGTEALIRWRTKSGDFIQPSEFIPLMEESGQIVAVGNWVMQQAAKQLSKWRKCSANRIRMAINVSVRQLCEDDFVQKLREVLIKYNIPFHLFELEITENVQIEGNTEIQASLNMIREMGVAISIDDFGTGYSSLFYLKNLPMNRIKIAKELVDDIERFTYSHAIIRMAIEIAKSNNMSVIAEGVETEEQWKCLQALQCDEIQGYYFSKPIPADEVYNVWIKNSI